MGGLVLPGLQCDRRVRSLLEEYAHVLRLHGLRWYSWRLGVGWRLRELLDLREQGPSLRRLPLRLPGRGGVSSAALDEHLAASRLRGTQLFHSAGKLLLAGSPS